ncbi:MAG: NAD(P)-dependent oxidoreductase [Candidatus Nomurabacteria bacterium]|nr:MAG: NAD(P)-dependent oxidoreductase [Candidatus Nomurabacteria bacterium]
MKETDIFIVGANGQLGTALRQKYPNAKSADSDTLDITDRKSVENYDWSGIKVLINSAAYTNVNGAETPKGRTATWAVNATAVGNLAQVARQNNITLVHISTDYVFDGTITPHLEDEPFSPLSVYGASKASGDLLVSTLQNYYILRTSWVIGEGKNFVRTMLDLAHKGINPSVVNDQIGRLTFTGELVKAIDFILSTKAPFGTYNITNDGQSTSWAEITKTIYRLSNLTNTVTGVSTKDYYKDKQGIAPRPLQSELSLDKIKSLGYKPQPWLEALKEYLTKNPGN